LVKGIILKSNNIKVFIAEKDFYTGIKSCKTFYDNENKCQYVEFKYFIKQIYKNNIDYILALFEFGYDLDLIELFNFRKNFLTKQFFKSLGKIANNYIRNFNKTDNILLAISAMKYYIKAFDLLAIKYEDQGNFDKLKFNKINKILLNTKEKYNNEISKLNIRLKPKNYNKINNFVSIYIFNKLKE